MFTCIVCLQKLESIDLGEIGTPSQGVVFTSPGNYGSTVFDEISGSFLSVVICDECLANAGRQKIVQLGKPRKPAKKFDYSIWEAP